MKLIGCGRTRALLAARAAGLSANEQDALDAHLQTCGDCREQARLLDEIVLAVGVMPSRTPAARERTIERALRQGLEQACKPPFWKSRSALTVGTVVLGGALAATVALVIMRGSERPLQPTLVERPNLRRWRESHAIFLPVSRSRWRTRACVPCVARRSRGTRRLPR
jgi:anti-sigma factor RsiW